MTRLGIEDYEPRWIDGRRGVMTLHGHRLAGLSGLVLRHVWLVWDLTADEWFTDAPVVLDFGTATVGIDHQKFNDVSIARDTIDPHRPIRSPSFDLAWRAEPRPPLADLPGRTLDHVELLEWQGRDMAGGSIAIGFDFGGTWLTVFNAMDENGLEHHAPGPEYRRYRIDR